MSSREMDEDQPGFAGRAAGEEGSHGQDAKEGGTSAARAELDLTDRESEELLHRIGRGVRAMVGDVLLDPLPPGFKMLLDRLEGTERSRGRA